MGTATYMPVGFSRPKGIRVQRESPHTLSRTKHQLEGFRAQSHGRSSSLKLPPLPSDQALPEQHIAVPTDNLVRSRPG